jgi:hypothetical protein
VSGSAGDSLFCPDWIATSAVNPRCEPKEVSAAMLDQAIETCWIELLSNDLINGRPVGMRCRKGGLGISFHFRRDESSKLTKMPHSDEPILEHKISCRQDIHLLVKLPELLSFRANFSFCGHSVFDFGLEPAPILGFVNTLYPSVVC